MRRKYLWIVSAAVFSVTVLALVSLHAAKSDAHSSYSGLAITVYNQQFAVVRQPIELNLQEGINNVRYSETTAHLEPDSVMLRDPSGEHQLRILEQNYRNDAITEARLLYEIGRAHV